MLSKIIALIKANKEKNTRGSIIFAYNVSWVRKTSRKQNKKCLVSLLRVTKVNTCMCSKHVVDVDSVFSCFYLLKEEDEEARIEAEVIIKKCEMRSVCFEKYSSRYQRIPLYFIRIRAYDIFIYT